MKIIKQGSDKILNKVKTFECRTCGCMFEADKSEYQVGRKYNESYYYCKCPYCGNSVTTD